MKTFNLVCAGLALSGLIVSAILWRDLRAQRGLMAGWQRAHPEVASSNPVQSSPSLPSAANASPAPSGTADANSAARRATPSVSEQIAHDREQLKDPEYRRNLQSRLRLQMPQEHPELVEKLGLSTGEAGRLFDLLAEQQLELTNLLATSSGDGTGDPTAIRAMLRGRQEMERRHEESLASLLGDARYQKWQEYQQTRHAQQQVERQYAPAMRSLSQALSETQVQALGAVLVAEQKRQQQEVQRLRGSTPQPGPPNLGQMLEETVRRRTESNGRIIAAARPHLTAQQLESLRAALDREVTALDQQATALRGSSR